MKNPFTQHFESMTISPKFQGVQNSTAPFICLLI